jgi:hypothetical protein
VHRQLAAVRLGQLSKRIAVPGPRPWQQVSSFHDGFTFVLVPCRTL